MKYIIPLTFVLIIFFQTGFSQTPTPTPIETDDVVVKISTNLVQVDVTVTDKKGKPVTDLKAEDFEIYENGKKQNISNFSFISVANKQNSEPKNNDIKDQISIPTPTNGKIKPGQIRRTIALVVDDLTLSFESVHYVRRALKKFLDEQMQDGDLVAIIRTSGGIGALQQFTTDKRQLYAAVNKIKFNLVGTGGASTFAPIQPTALEDAKSNGVEVSDEDLQNEKNRIQENNQFRENSFVVGTLGAINYTVRGMSKLPGRKSVILLSDGFSLFSTSQQFLTSNKILEDLRKLIDLANRSSVVIYSIDGRGLVYTGLTAADDTAGLSGQALQARSSDRTSELLETQAGLIYLSKETGGFAIYNANDIPAGIEQVLEDQSYYLIGYQPDDDTFDTEKRRFNKLDIRVKQDNLKVRYRSGFFNVSEEQIQNPDNKPTENQILKAISSPFAVNDINLTLNTLFRGDKKNNLFLNSYVFIDPKDLVFTDEPNGNKKAVFDILAINFGDNGVPIDEISRTYTMNVKKEGFENFVKNGFVYNFSFPIKKSGAYQMRIAIRDQKSEKVGSASQFIEVPKLKNNRLTLSGVGLENLSYEQWKTLNQPGQANQSALGTRNKSDSLIDTALRQFKKGTVLKYDFEIYNARTDNNQNSQLEMRTRVFYNGKIVYEGKNLPINMLKKDNSEVIPALGAFNLGTNMQIGDYILQIIVTDKLAKEKHQIATQYVQFELVN